MGTNTVAAVGGVGRKDAIKIDPGKLHVVDDPTHPLFDERVNLPLDPALVESVRRIGVMNPIHVRRTKENKLLVVAGRRRTRAAVAAKVETVPILIVGEDDVAEEWMYAENELRTADPPTVRARKLARLKETKGLDEACRIMGIGTSAGRLLLATLGLEPVVQEKIDAGVVPYAEAVRTLKGVPAEEQVAAIASIESAPAKGAKRREALEKAAKSKKRERSRPTIAEIREATEKARGNAKLVLLWVLGEGDLPESMS